MDFLRNYGASFAVAILLTFAVVAAVMKLIKDRKNGKGGCGCGCSGCAMYDKCHNVNRKK